MSKFEKIEGIWNNLGASYNTIGAGESPMEFIKKLLNYDETGAGERVLLKIVRESGEDPERVEAVAKKIELAYSNLDYYIKHSMEVERVEQFLTQRSDAPVGIESSSILPITEFVSASRLFEMGQIMPVTGIITENGYRRICNYKCPDYKYVCETERDVVTLFQQLKDTGSDNATLYAMAAGIKAKELGAPLVVANQFVAADASKAFKMKEIICPFRGKDYKLLKRELQHGSQYVLVVEE